MLGDLVNRLSAYQRDRVFFKEVYASESARLVTDATGMLDKGEVIVFATWETGDTMNARMAAPSIEEGGKQASVAISAQYSGRSRIRTSLTTSAGRVISAWHYIRVKSAPSFPDQAWVEGPRRLDAVP